MQSSNSKLVVWVASLLVTITFSSTIVWILLKIKLFLGG